MSTTSRSTPRRSWAWSAWAEKSLSNLLGAIERSKEQPFSRVLVALGIDLVGSEVAGLLARHFKSIDALMAAEPDRLTEIPDIGPKIALSVADHFADAGNRAVIEKLRAGGVRMEEDTEESPVGERSLDGLRFVVTGRLQNFSRAQIESRVKELGGAVSSSVSARTDYLIAGEDAGSKLADAERNGTTVLSEDAFLAMADQGQQTQAD